MWSDITKEQKEQFNKLATHPLQSFEWGEFRKKTGILVIRRGLFRNNKLTQAFQLTIHPIPHTFFTIGYLPKGLLPTKESLSELTKIGKEQKCIFIQLEPNIISRHSGEEHTTTPESLRDAGLRLNRSGQASMTKLVHSAHPLFTKYTLQLDLTKSEEELLKQMHPKTRYNIRVAQKHGVTIIEDNSPEAFEQYWQLMDETTKRQGFYAHTKKYHEMMWNLLTQPVILNKVKNLPFRHSGLDPESIDSRLRGNDVNSDKNILQAHLLLAKYNPPSTINHQPLTAWMLFTFKDTLYYPYGASSRKYREVMAQNLMMWEAIRFGKKLGLKTFDMWGSLGENPDTKDPWYGFHRFKLGYNPTLVEFVGSYDLVISPLLYEVYKLADKMRTRLFFRR